jgi:cytochrome b pre-mRNA-processing protein 3
MARLWRRRGSRFSTGVSPFQTPWRAASHCCRCICFAVLHGLTREGSEGRALAQELVDRFNKDLETVLRELGVSDIRVPKSMRGLAASSQRPLTGYEAAFATGEPSIKESLPGETANPGLSSKALASYLTRCVNQLELQPLASLQTGALEFPEANEKP